MVLFSEYFDIMADECIYIIVASIYRWAMVSLSTNKVTLCVYSLKLLLNYWIITYSNFQCGTLLARQRYTIWTVFCEWYEVTWGRLYWFMSDTKWPEDGSTGLWVILSDLRTALLVYEWYEVTWGRLYWFMSDTKCPEDGSTGLWVIRSDLRTALLVYE